MPEQQGESAELGALADDCAAEARAYIATVTEVASGSAPDAAIPMCLLAVSQVLLMGARLGAIQDIVLVERFEPDPGPEAEVEPTLQGLANLFEGVDTYAHVTDPLTDTDLVEGSLSGDLTDVVSALVHGLRHHEQGRAAEALWWWQFSYLSGWGESASRALRVLQSLLAHVRLDTDEDTVSEAEFDALHP